MKTVSKLDSQEVTRLFSNLVLDRNKLSHQPGSVLGSTALVAGTTVGVGVLALLLQLHYRLVLSHLQQDALLFGSML